MQKLAKRTLAFLLVVCALFGLVAVPAAATDGETTETTPKTYTYDFTVLSNKDGQYEFDAEHVAWNTSNTDFFGFGGITTRTAKTYDVYAVEAINKFYNEGKLTWTSNKVEHTTELDLNWAFLTEGQIKDRESKGIVTFGGYNYNNQSQIAGGKITEKIAKYYNGIEYAPKFVNDAGATKGAATGWFAIKIKAPDIGRYAITLDYTKTNYGTRDASVLLLPGAVTDEAVILEAIANGTGKLENSVNFFADKYKEVIPDATIRNDRIYAKPTNYYAADHATYPGRVSTDAGLTGNVATLGTVDITAPVEEYTVIFVANKGRYNETDETSATTNYTANIYLDGLTFTELEPVDSRKAVTYNFGMNHIEGSTITAGTALSTTNAAGVDVSVISALDAMYTNGTTGWSYLGGTYTSTAALAGDYLEMKAFGSNANMNDSRYVALKLRSPGKGEYTLDMATYVAARTSGKATATAHMWLNAYLVKLDSSKTYEEQWTDAKAAGVTGEYKPAFVEGRTYNEMHDESSLLTAEFEEGTDYILFLERNAAGDYKNTEEDTPEKTKNYSPNNIYIKTITATEIPLEATIGKDVVPPADKNYDFNLYGQDAATFPDKVLLADKKTEISNLYATNGWDYLGSTALGSAAYAPRSEATGYLHFNNMGTAAKPSYAAFKLKSPGAGEYTLDITTFVATSKPNPGTDGNQPDKVAHLWMNVYLVELDSAKTYEEQLADAKTAGATAEYKPEFKVRSATGFETEEALVTINFVEGAEYILFLERHPEADTNNKAVEGDEEATRRYSPNNIYLNAITAKSTILAQTAEKFTTLTAALDAAEAGETIYLQSDVLLSSVSVPENVTLDLNGYKLTTSAFTTFEGGKIIDSVGTGLLNVLADNVTFEGNNPLAENTLPIYDAANTGYRFFEYSYSAWGADDDAQYKDREEGGVEGAVRFWYQLNFADAKAYELIAAGNSGVQLGVNVNLNGEVIQKCNFKYADESESTWMQDWASLKADGEAKWLWVRIQDAAGVEGLSITPVISAGGLKDVELAKIPSVQQ